jgi:hypothetical protein
MEFGFGRNAPDTMGQGQLMHMFVLKLLNRSEVRNYPAPTGLPAETAMPF